MDNSTFIYFSNNKSLTKLRHDIYITIEDYLVTFHLENNETFSYCKPLKKVVKLLPNYFIQINRNTLINSRKIKKVIKSKREIVLVCGLIQKVSIRRKGDVYRQIASTDATLTG